MVKRNPAICFILSLVTFGIYGLYWMVQLNNDVQYMSQTPKPNSGGKVIGLTLITCGLYGIYWAYNMGTQLDGVCEAYQMPTQSRGVLYLVLHVLGLGFVAWILMQNTLNSFFTDAPAE